MLTPTIREITVIKLKKSFPQKPLMQHFFGIKFLDQKTLLYLLDRAIYLYDSVISKNKVLDTLQGKVIANLFFESSTRAKNSFEIAEHRLGAIVLSPNMKQSSTNKGELLIDTVRNFEAMGASLLVIRHSQNNLAQFLAMESTTGISVINAGDGYNEHPTQALIDILTIRQHFPDFSNRKIAICGDIAHSRVARSLVLALQLMNIGKIHLIAPKNFIPVDDEDYSKCEFFEQMDAGIKDVDIIYMLRIQKERMNETEHPKDELYFKEFGLTKKRVALAKTGAIVMHPGPINRGIEIESSVADGPQSVILQQTKNSVAVRMAVVETVLAGIQ